MSDDVLITPASRKIEFKDNAGNVDGKIELDGNGNLNITSPGGDIGLGDPTADVFIGDGTNNVDIVFEQNGEIRALTGKTLTLGQSDSNVTVTAQNFTANGLSYPTSDGTNGQVLATNGSGTLSFSTVSSSGAYDLNGGKLTIDTDGDLYIEAPSDDYLTFNFLNDDKFFMHQSGFGPVTGVTGTQLGSSNQSWQLGYIDYVYSTQLQATTYNVNLNGSIVFEGSSADNYETTLTVANPTGDRTITLPNATGTVLLTDGDGSNLTGVGFDESSTTFNLSAGLRANNSTNSATGARYNVAIGRDANAGTSVNGAFVAAIGYEALKVNQQNGETAVGYQALKARTFGGFPNAAFGYLAGSRVTTGAANTYVGPYVYGATTGSYNNAIGFGSHNYMTSGDGNVALGRNCGQDITTGDYNTNIGYLSGQDITSGDHNITIGYYAGKSLTTSDDNIFIGREAGRDLTGFGDDDNIAIGAGALITSTSSSQNIAIGSGSMGNYPGSHNTCVGGSSGYGLNSASAYNTMIGFSAGSLVTSGEKNTFLGGYNGNESSLDLRTSDNNVVLSDGDGNVRQHINSSGDTLFYGDVGLDGGSNSDWAFNVDANGDLLIKVGGTAKAKLDTNGNLTVVGNVTAYGSI